MSVPVGVGSASAAGSGSGVCSSSVILGASSLVSAAAEMSAGTEMTRSVGPEPACSVWPRSADSSSRTVIESDSVPDGGGFGLDTVSVAPSAPTDRPENRPRSSLTASPSLASIGGGSDSSGMDSNGGSDADSCPTVADDFVDTADSLEGRVFRAEVPAELAARVAATRRRSLSFVHAWASAKGSARPIGPAAP